jgi:hypothetical protein
MVAQDRSRGGSALAKRAARSGEQRMSGRVPAALRHEERECLLRVCCEPGSDVLGDLETFTTAYLKRRFRPNLAQALSLATYELCSNAISYASVATDVTFELWVSSTGVELEVVNQAVTARIHQLQQMLDRIQGDPEQTYLSEMKRSISGRMPRPMLGLARVAHEASMQIDLQVDERQVRITAHCKR